MMTRYCEGMKEYYSYVVQLRHNMEVQSHKNKIAIEVRKYQEKLEIFKKYQQEHNAVFYDALVVSETDDVNKKKQQNFTGICLTSNQITW